MVYEKGMMGSERISYDDNDEVIREDEELDLNEMNEEDDFHINWW